jgi:hypothetical protein
MPDADKLTPADADLAKALAFRRGDAIPITARPYSGIRCRWAGLRNRSNRSQVRLCGNSAPA